MAITHLTALRNTLADAGVDGIDGGTTDATGDLMYMTSGDVEVATLAFSNPAFGNASSSTATANAISSDTNATGGTIALFKTQNRDNTEQWRGAVTVTGGGGDIELTSVIIAATETVSTSSLTYTAPV